MIEKYYNYADVVGWPTEVKYNLIDGWTSTWMDIAVINHPSFIFDPLRILFIENLGKPLNTVICDLNKDT